MAGHGLITLKEAAELCSVSQGTLRRLIAEEGIPIHHQAGGLSVHWKDLHKALVRRGLPVPGDLEAGPRIVLVDDNPDQLLVMVDVFESLWDRVRIATARDGEKGLQRVLELRPDLLVTDLQMPNLSGIELCRWVRQNRELEHTKILAITGYHDQEKHLAVFESGADEYLRKPFTPEDLRQSAERLLGLFPPAAQASGRRR